MKQRESITIDPDVNLGIHKEAEKQRLKFSTLVNRILHQYLIKNKKQ